MGGKEDHSVLVLWIAAGVVAAIGFGAASFVFYFFARILLGGVIT